MVASDPNQFLTLASSDTTLGRLADFKMVTLDRPYKKYVNVAKFYAKKNETWKNTSKDGVIPEYYSMASTHFRLHASGFTTGARIARMHVVWYVAFKGT